VTRSPARGSGRPARPAARPRARPAAQPAGSPVLRTLFWLVVAGLALPALLLTTSRLLDSDNGSMIRLVSFTPVGVVLWGLLVFLLSSRAALRRDHRPLRVGAVVVAGLALFCHLLWVGPQFVGANPAPAAGAEPITVMNANLFEGRADAAQVAATVRREGVDVLVLEEITPDFLADLDAAGIADVLPNRAGGTDPFVAGTMVLSGLSLGKPALLDTEFQSYRMSVGDLTLLAVHPTAPVLPDAWRADHDVIRDEADRSHADLIVGDMNATPDHDVMRKLDGLGFRDAGELANEGPQPTWPANHLGVAPFLPPVIRIDHVLVADTLASLGTRTVDVDGTDHLALIAEVAPR
jgi:endonuclease/exonuclease/phosphatase (EEP) superfamily protein YafD